jgi:hypothetical protein
MAKAKLKARQVDEDTLQDADNDTRVQVEKSPDEDKIRFDTAGTERMIITNDGKVGIGTASPIETLHVNGNIKAGEVYTDKIRRATDSGTTTKILLDDEVIKLHAGDSTNQICTVDATGLKINGNCTIDLGADGEALKLVGTISHETRFVFEQPAGTDRASMEIDAGDNLDIKNYSSLDDINFMTTDGSTTKTSMVITAVNRVGVGKFGWAGKNEYGYSEDFPSCEMDVSGSLNVSEDAQFKGGVYYNVRDVNTSSAILDSDYVLRCIQSGDITLTLPTRVNNAGRVLIFKDTMGNAGPDVGHHNITIQGDTTANPDDTIDGSATYVINSPKESVTLTCDGINGWMITSRVVP